MNAATDTAPEGAEETKMPVDIAKLLGTVEVRDAFETALERYGKSGADLTYHEVTFVIVATDADGWTGAADTGSLYLEDYQAKEDEPAAEADTPATPED